MTNGLLIYGEIFAHFFLFPHILGSPSSYMTFQLRSTLNFLIYEENLVFLFYQCREYTEALFLNLSCPGIDSASLCSLSPYL
jgi:hypothetical protein